MTTLNLATDVQFGVSTYTGQRSVRYAACPHCGGEIHRYPRLAWPHGFRLFGKCADGCGWAAWEHEESDAILARLGVQVKGRAA